MHNLRFTVLTIFGAPFSGNSSIRSVVGASPCLFPERFHRPRRKLCPRLSASSPFGSPAAPATPVRFLSLRLFRPRRCVCAERRGVRPSVPGFSRSAESSRSVPAGRGVSRLSLCLWRTPSRCARKPRFVCPFVRSRALGPSPHLGRWVHEPLQLCPSLDAVH